MLQFLWEVWVLDFLEKIVNFLDGNKILVLTLEISAQAVSCNESIGQPEVTSNQLFLNNSINQR